MRTQSPRHAGNTCGRKDTASESGLRLPLVHFLLEHSLGFLSWSFFVPVSSAVKWDSNSTGSRCSHEDEGEETNVNFSAEPVVWIQHLYRAAVFSLSILPGHRLAWKPGACREMDKDTGGPRDTQGPREAQTCTCIASDHTCVVCSKAGRASPSYHRHMTKSCKAGETKGFLGYGGVCHVGWCFTAKTHTLLCSSPLSLNLWTSKGVLSTSLPALDCSPTAPRGPQQTVPLWL